MSDSPTEYLLSAAELPSLRAFLTFQSAFGPGIKTMVLSDQNDYLNGLISLANAYPGVQNVKVKAWFEQLFALLTATDDAGQHYLVWQYLLFCQTSRVVPPSQESINAGSYDQWVSYWYVFDAQHGGYGWSTPWTGSDQHYNWYSTLNKPGAPASWQSKIQSLLTKWGDTPPASFVQPGAAIADRHTVINYETGVLQLWTAFTQLGALTMPVWQAQRDTANALLASASLTADAYFFMLYLLVGLGTSKASDQLFAKQIIGAATSSPEYPNDTFINQLVYLVLMHLADPLGNFGFDNATLQRTLNDIDQCIKSTDAASQAIKQSLENHIKILKSDSSYPMQDPYNPSIGFNTRIADTLAALDQARASIHAVAQAKTIEESNTES